MAEKREFHARTERIEELVNKLERASDPELHTAALELVQSVMELHGAALEHLLEIVSQSNEGESVTGKFLEDDLVASVLLLHGLHPEEMETRVLRALDKVRPFLQSNGGDVELVSIVDGVVKLRVQKEARWMWLDCCDHEERRGGCGDRSCSRRGANHGGGRATTQLRQSWW